MTSQTRITSRVQTLRCTTSHVCSTDIRERYVIMAIVEVLTGTEQRTVEMVDEVTRCA